MANGTLTQRDLETNSPQDPQSTRPVLRQALTPDRMANGHLTQDISPHRPAGRVLRTQDFPTDRAASDGLTADLYEDRAGSRPHGGADRAARDGLTADLYEDRAGSRPHGGADRAASDGLTPDLYEDRVGSRPHGGDSEADMMMGEEGQADNCPTGQVRQGTCCSRCRAEFRLRNFSLSHPNPELFYSCQWSWPPLLFLFYRFVVAGYILAWLVTTGVNFPEEIPFPWPVWLTNWSYLLLTCHLVLALVIAVFHHGSTWRRGSRGCCHRSSSYSGQDWHGEEPRHSTSGILGDSSEGAVTGSSSEFTVDFEQVPDALPWYVKLNWLLFAVVSNISFIVTLVYFVALYPQLVNLDSTPPLVEDLHLHLLNSVVILLELGITALPIRLLHALYPLSYGLIYVIFSAIYWGVDHKNVLYPEVLDWNTPGRTIVIVLILALVFVPMFQLLVYGLYRLRLVIHRRTSRWGL